MGGDWIYEQASAGKQAKRGVFVGLVRPPARSRIHSRPCALMGSNYSESLFVDITVEVDRFRVSARARQQHYAPAEAGQFEGGGNGLGMAGGVDDDGGVFPIAVGSEGILEFIVCGQCGVDVKH